MRKWMLFLMVAFVLPFSACEDDEGGMVEEAADLNVTFRLLYDDAPLVMFDDYALNDSVRVLFSRFSMYLTDFALTRSDGSMAELEDIGFYNLTDSHMDAAGAAEGYTLNFTDLETGDYSGLSFGLGLPPALNGQAPDDFEMGHPLNAPEEYWIGWESYVFVKIEGKIDADDNPDEFEGNMALHLGGDEIFRDMLMSKPFSLEGGMNEMVVEIDIYDMFHPADGEAYDLLDRPMIHSTAHLPQANELIDNLMLAIQ